MSKSASVRRISFTRARSAPGLDYALLSDSVLMLSRSLVFDTERFSEAGLARLGLRRADSRASDHLPVVVDFR